MGNELFVSLNSAQMSRIPEAQPTLPGRGGGRPESQDLKFPRLHVSDQDEVRQERAA